MVTNVVVCRGSPGVAGPKESKSNTSYKRIEAIHEYSQYDCKLEPERERSPKKANAENSRESIG